MLQVLLPNGRGIRFSMLSATDSDELVSSAIKLLGETSTMAELRTKVGELGIKQMLSAVTEKAGLKDVDLLNPDTKWKLVNVEDLDANYNKYFNAKTHKVLGHLYNEYHEVGKDEADAIVKKVQEVAID